MQQYLFLQKYLIKLKIFFYDFVLRNCIIVFYFLKYSINTYSKS